jgi:hypothetical protein
MVKVHVRIQTSEQTIRIKAEPKMTEMEKEMKQQRTHPTQPLDLREEVRAEYMRVGPLE